MVRFSLGLPSSIQIEKIVEYSKTAEEFYYDFLWLKEESPTTLQKDPYTILKAMASNTESICIGPWGLDLNVIEPSLIASYTASLSEFSKGRAVTSIKDTPERASKEGFRIIKSLLAGETVDFNGEIFKVKNLKLPSKPVLTSCHGPRDVPLYVVCNSVESLRWAGKNADGVLVRSPLKYFPTVMAEIKAGADEAGRSLDGFDVANWLPWSISMDTKEAREFVKPQVARVVAQTSPEIIQSLGIKVEEVEAMKQSLESEPERIASQVTEQMLDHFSISGPYWECNKKVKELIKLGGWPDVRGRVQIVVGYPYGPSEVEAIKTIGDETVKIFRLPYDC